jgi:hypothetical protein
MTADEEVFYDDEIEEHDCGRFADGNGCLLAGTEWCDWDCWRGHVAKLRMEGMKR